MKQKVYKIQDQRALVYKEESILTATSCSFLHFTNIMVKVKTIGFLSNLLYFIILPLRGFFMY